MFYDGGGVTGVAPMTDEELAAYLKAAGLDEAYTDIAKMPAAEADRVLTEKAGTTVAENEKGFEGWTYLADYDAYYGMHGDTNYDAVTVVGGNVSADGVWEVTYTLEYAPADMGEKNVVTLQETDDGFVFLSNREFIE